MTTERTEQLRLTREELLAIGDLHGVGGYPGLEFSFASEEDREAQVGAGARSLMARGLVSVETEPADAVSPAAALAPALAPLVPPAFGTFVHRFEGGEGALQVWWLEPDHVVRQVTDAFGVTTFAAMEPEEGHRLLADWLGADDREAPAGNAFQVDEGAVMEVFSGLTGGEDGGEAAPAQIESATERLRELAAGCVRVNRVDLIWQPEDGDQEQGAVTWLDCGDAGCWMITPIDGDEETPPTRFDVIPVSPRDAYDRIIMAIPGFVDDDG